MAEKNKITAETMQNALEQLSNGEKTLNDIREELGLKRIDEEWADALMVKRA